MLEFTQWQIRLGYLIGPLTLGLLRDVTRSFRIAIVFPLALVTTVIVLTFGLSTRRVE